MRATDNLWIFRVKSWDWPCWRAESMIHLLHLLAAMLGLGIGMGQVSAAHWAHSTDLDNNYSVFWTPGEDHITFEVQVRTLGYIGFGFSVDGQMPGADIVVGWFQDNQVFLQDRHAPAGDQRIEPLLDSSQDYELLLGYENGTHTVIRFRRRYDTCDSEDYRISNDTMRMLYAYHSEDPGSGGVMLYHGPVQRGARSIYLMERVNLEQPPSRELLSWELRNPAIILPASGDTLYWCKIFKLPNIRHKYHMVRYEPILQNGNRGYMHHVIVYECQGSDGDFEPHSRDKGQVCYQPNMPPLFYNCNNVVIAWAIGSEGFSFPAEAGYPLDPDSGTRYYMMETHYNNPNPTQDFEVTDSSGIRVYYTPTLRRHDAGVLSVGLDPNWRHIIPPGQTEVRSEGHCVSACTKQAIPPQGIDIFAVILHTHLIGRKVRFRQIRNGVELPPITADNNYDFNYQEYRRLQNPVKVHPGDHLIAECVYNSEGRATITLGGLSSHEEMCLVFGLYYPRVDLSLCHSLPSLPTVLHSLGIQELWPGSSPVRIKSPPDLADMTLENRLITYDWENNFKSFEDATHRGSFKPLCWMKKPTLLPGTEDTEEFYPNITKPYEEVSFCHSRWKKPRRRKKPGDSLQDGGAGDNSEERYGDSDVGAKGSEEEEEEDKTKVYSSVSLQETSRLNSGSYIFAKRVHVVVCVASVMLFRR